MNKSVLISNLEVLAKELVKIENEIGKEYATTLSSTRKSEITKEEFYIENALTITMDAIENINFLAYLLKEETPESVVKIAEEEDRDFREISKDMKAHIVHKKLEDNPLLGMVATFEALIKMAEDRRN